ncbi:hypothetical protein BKA62DRAFT_680879 [Auriculariales sp. MPI-PUGE-AT-0066]|nr:hypothetical protein BKA62DRAFT_680879 [Auriculariales sp. MPI-PUGE-AT-0066]
MLTDEPMEIDSSHTTLRDSAPLSLSIPGEVTPRGAESNDAAVARVPFPMGPPSPVKQHQSASTTPYKRPSIHSKSSSRSWRSAEFPGGRSCSPTKSNSSSSFSSSWSSSGRSSSPTKSSRSSLRAPSPTSLPWSEGKIPQSPLEPSSAAANPNRKRPPSLRLHDNPNGVDPTHIIGKTLRTVHRGASHPNLTLVFDDNSSVQVKIEGYHPNLNVGGLSKELEMDESLDSVLNPTGITELNTKILDCTMVRMKDKAFEIHEWDEARDSRWDQHHLGIAFKFEGLPNRWYTVWATMTDRDGDGGAKLLSYDDVFLSATTPRRPRHARKKSIAQDKP